MAHTTMPTVFLLHGLGGHPVVMFPMLCYLRRRGFQHIFSITYNTKTKTVEASLRSAHAAMLRTLRVCHPRQCTSPILLVGHSWGGLVANRLHTFGWRIAGAIYLASPLQGAAALRYVHARIPAWLTRVMMRAAYHALLSKQPEAPPPHPFHTISCGIGTSSFDGAVFAQETVLAQEHHTHLPWHYHATVIFRPVLWRLLAARLHAFLRPSSVVHPPLPPPPPHPTRAAVEGT